MQFEQKRIPTLGVPIAPIFELNELLLKEKLLKVHAFTQAGA